MGRCHGAEGRHSARACDQLHECSTVHTLYLWQTRNGLDMKTSHTAQRDLILHGVTITHPERIVFKEGKITKGDVANYYAAVAPYLLREIKRRPLSLVRCPSGVRAGCFYQRNVGVGLGPEVYPFVWDYKGSRYQYIYVKDEQGLMEMIQMGVIEIHPWARSLRIPWLLMQTLTSRPSRNKIAMAKY